MSRICMVILLIWTAIPELFAQLYAPEIKVQDTETRVVATNGSGGSTLLRGDRLAVYQGEGSVVSFGGSYLNINRNNSICGAILTFARRGGTDWSIKNSRDDCGVAGGLHFLNTGRATRLSILQNGNVGIGNSNPQHKLNVHGTIAHYGNLIHSDERLKKDIKDYSMGLDLVKKVKVKKYKYKKPEKNFSTNPDEDEFYEGETMESDLAEVDSFYEREQIGVLAQELQQIAPDLVSTYSNGEDPETLTINQTALTFVLINAVKELSAEVEMLKEAASTKTTK